ncbi:MAG TPA: ABC transporter ATP-binding protein [Blastocatellia bacterium]|nr:ABC transporter ATP-binding protein [Blastocatellia bacterium]
MTVREENRPYAVETENLWRTFGSVEALRSVTLQVPRGSIFGLLGANGSGKSTLLKLLMGHLKPTRGRIRILGHPLDGECIKLRERVGYVAEHHYLYEWMTVREIIHFTRAFHATWDDEKASALVRRFNLPLSKRVRELSRGNRARLALTLALSFNPELLLLDEPTTGLDPIVRRDFTTHILGERTESQQTVLFSSHIVEEVEKVADHVGILHEGRLLLAAPIKWLKESVRKIRCRTNGRTISSTDVPGFLRRESVNGDEWIIVRDFSEAILQALQDRGIVPLDVESLTLEEIFVETIMATTSEGARQ